MYFLIALTTFVSDYYIDWRWLYFYSKCISIKTIIFINPQLVITHKLRLIDTFKLLMWKL